MPADTSLADLPAVTVVAVKGTGGFARDVPRERGEEDENDSGGGDDDDITAVEAAAADKGIGLKRRHESEENGGEVPCHHIRYGHEEKMEVVRSVQPGCWCEG